MVQQTSFLQRLFRTEKIRFVLVGFVNTVVDFVVLLSLVVVFGVPSGIANIFSTSVALATSYVLNKNAVFGNTDRHNRKQVALFIIVTLTGLWIVQSILIVVIAGNLKSMLPHMDEAYVLVIAKLIATAFSLIWNYMWYSRVVFKKGKA